MSQLSFPLSLLASFWTDDMTVCTLAPVLRPYFEHCVYYFLACTSPLCLKYSTNEIFQSIKSGRKRPTQDRIWTFGGWGANLRTCQPKGGAHLKILSFRRDLLWAQEVPIPVSGVRRVSHSAPCPQGAFGLVQDFHPGPVDILSWKTLCCGQLSHSILCSTLSSFPGFYLPHASGTFPICENQKSPPDIARCPLRTKMTSTVNKNYNTPSSAEGSSHQKW